MTTKLKYFDEFKAIILDKLHTIREYTVKNNVFDNGVRHTCDEIEQELERINESLIEEVEGEKGK